MSIQERSEGLVLVELPEEPTLNAELKKAMSYVRDTGDCDVILDCANVGMVTSSSLSLLLRLKVLQSDSRRRLLLCNVGKTAKHIFAVTGIEGLFEFVDDKLAALASLRSEET